MFVLGKPFQPSLMFARKAGESTLMESLTGQHYFIGSLLALTSNIRLGWECSAETKALSYKTAKLIITVYVS